MGLGDNHCEARVGLFGHVMERERGVAIVDCNVPRIHGWFVDEFIILLMGFHDGVAGALLV